MRAPGRVNLIGEHTDYSGLPVMPIAIDRSTIIVAAPRDDSKVELRNRRSTFYRHESFALEASIPPYPTGDWANYVKAGFQGVIDHFGKRGVGIEQLRGLEMIVDGRVPPAAGLSSSAALTVSSALALMAANGLAQDALETAQMVARSEWYVGTMAGGMDQAASMLGRRDHALLIHFDPLRVTPVKMPPGAAIVVADSLEVADKAGRVREEYNRRVVECAIAARIIGKALGLENVRVLGDVVKQIEKWSAHDIVETLAGSAPETRQLRASIEAFELLTKNRCARKYSAMTASHRDRRVASARDPPPRAARPDGDRASLCSPRKRSQPDASKRWER